MYYYKKTNIQKVIIYGELIIQLFEFIFINLN